MMIPMMLTVVVLGAPPADEVLAQVDGRPVTARQFVERVKLTRASGAGADPRALVEDLVNDELLAREGYRQGLDKEPSVTAAFETMRLKWAAERFLEKQVYSTVKIDDEQVRHLFHETGDAVHLRMIIVATADEAKALLERLTKGAQFAEEAKHSLDPTGIEKKGDYGELTRGQLEGDARETAFAAPLGTPVGPVKLPLGVAVLLVESRTIADEATLATRRPDIVRFAEAQTRAMLRKHIVGQLRTKQHVTLDDDFLKSTGTRLDATPAQAERVIARVGRRQVTYGAVLAQQRKTFGGAMGSHMSGARVKAELAWSEIDDLLLQDAAVAAGFGQEPETLAAARRAERDAVIRELATRTRASVAQPDDPSLQAFLDLHSAEFTRPASRACNHLVVRDASEARELRSQLAKGDRFEELAVEHSLDKASAVKGGLLGTLDDRVLDDLAAREPALAAAMRTAQPNVVSGPVKGTMGWHLVRCGAVTPAHALSLAEARPQLSERAWQDARQASVGQLLTRLRRGAKVTLDEAALQRVVATLSEDKP